MEGKREEKVLDIDRLRAAIQEEYGTVASDPKRGYHFHTGRRLADILGYEDEWLRDVPDDSIDAFAGTGNPFSLGMLRPGERVVDVGCGAGIDSLIAARMVGPRGRVIGVDMTPTMLERAASSARDAGIANVEFRRGFGEDLTVDSGWADVVISNGVLNLMPDKSAGLSEMARVLKPSGRLQIADILVDRPVSDEVKLRIELWTGWIAGALLEAELRRTVEDAGFTGFEITWKAAVFDGAPQQSSAAAFGTQGINFRARKVVLLP